MEQKAISAILLRTESSSVNLGCPAKNPGLNGKVDELFIPVTFSIFNITKKAAWMESGQEILY